MNPRNKKGADSAKSTPRDCNTSRTNSTLYYSKLKRLCLSISIIGLTIIVIAYIKHSSNAGCFGVGFTFASMLMECVLNPIIEEEEENNG